MSPKRWFIMLGCAIILVFAIIVGPNTLIDPFSVFGDRIFKWNSYGMTLNPKAAKFDYVDRRRGEFDAFIIGPSGSSGISPAALEKYTGLRWYNMFNYGVDMEYTKRLANYLVETHRPQQIVLCLPLVSAAYYGLPAADLTTFQPMKESWRNPFVVAEPKYAFEKIQMHFKRRSYVQEPIDVFVTETGEYNKSRRDAEAIGPMDKYLNAYPDFVDEEADPVKLICIDHCAAALTEIVELCERYGTELTVVSAPLLADHIPAYDEAEVRAFYERMAGICEFWDFTISSVSYEPRYFYDTTHYRNSIGEMILARIYGDESVYVPEDFGVYVTRENASSMSAAFAQDAVTPEFEPYTADIPVLMYHHLDKDAIKQSFITPGRFEEQMRALSDSGYTAVSLEDVRDYVYKGRDLPQRPVLITFDDGYMSNYTEAFPVLRRYGFNAVIFVIGVTYGKDTYKDTVEPFIVHFGTKEALEMTQSGLISIQSHSYDMHDSERFDSHIRKGILRMEGESEKEYIAAFRNDHARMKALLMESIGEDVYAASYPYGAIDMFSAILMREQNVLITFSIEPGMNTLIKGLPQSLYELRRFTITNDMTGDDLIGLISPA